MKVLIVDEGRDSASVAAARALAATGWTVGVGCAAPDAPRASLAARSSATAALHQFVHTDDGEEAFARSVERVVREHGYDTVFRDGSRRWWRCRNAGSDWTGHSGTAATTGS